MTATTPHTTDRDKVLFKIRGLQIELEALIMATPTSIVRNSLCDANVMLMQAQAQLARQAEAGL